MAQSTGLPQLPCPSASQPGLHSAWVGIPPTHFCPPGHPVGTSHPSWGISLIAHPSMSPGGGWVSRLPCQPESVSTAACVDPTQGRLKTHVSSADVGVAGYSSADMVASDPAMGPGTLRGPGRAPRSSLTSLTASSPQGGQAGPGPDQQRGLLWERRLHALDLGQPAFRRSG